MVLRNLDKASDALKAAEQSVIAICSNNESPALTRMLRNILQWWTIDVSVLKQVLGRTLMSGKTELAAVILDSNHDPLRASFDRYLPDAFDAYSSTGVDSFNCALQYVRSRELIEKCLKNAARRQSFNGVKALLEHNEFPASKAAIRLALNQTGGSCSKLLRAALNKL